MFNSPSSKYAPLVAIVGPTAAGKSKVAYEVASQVGGEIISCDSLQVYQQLHIGTAKPSLLEQTRVRHHLLDVVSPLAAFDSATYVRLAREALADIQSRGKIALLCGGTGLYLRALRYGLVDLHGDSVAEDLRQQRLRGELQELEAREKGYLYRELTRLDPQSAKVIDPRNLVRVSRALEITLLKGLPASSLREQHGFKQEIVPVKLLVVDWETPLLALRISARIWQMFKEGFLAEVYALIVEQGLPLTTKGLQAVGYREVAALWQREPKLFSELLEILQAEQSEPEALAAACPPFAELVASIKQRTLQYVRRQRIWWRKESTLMPQSLASKWYSLKDEGEFTQVIAEIVALLPRLAEPE